MRFEAVIFDLFGTLIDDISKTEYSTILTEMASVLHLPPEDFIQLWWDTNQSRMIGELISPDGNIKYIAEKLGIRPTEEEFTIASNIRIKFSKRCLTPRPYSIDLLTRLKSDGYKTALISDCSNEVPSIWTQTPFSPLLDVTVFSCLAGIRKPDKGIYNLALNQLSVKAENCLYIGNGDSQELTGAQKAGLYPALLSIPSVDSSATHWTNRDTWNGTTISSLNEVLTLLE